MPILRINNSSAIAAADAVVDLIDAGVGAGTILIRTGAPPADPDAVATGTLLATITMSDPAFGAAADAAPGGRATAAAIAQVNAAVGGVAGYFEVLDSNSNKRMIGDITGVAGGGAMELANTNLAVGQPVDITSFTYTQPES